MSKANYKTLKISPELHKELKIYCVTNGIKLNVWIEEQLKNIIKETNEK